MNSLKSYKHFPLGRGLLDLSLKNILPNFTTEAYKGISLLSTLFYREDLWIQLLNFIDTRNMILNVLLMKIIRERSKRPLVNRLRVNLNDS